MATPEIPLRQWRIENFKSIEKAELTLSGLTVIVGPNSSGKSSILQSILAAAQAAQVRSTGPAFPLNGSLVQLGEMRDVKSTFAGAGKVVRLGAVFNLTRPRGASEDVRLRRTFSSSGFRHGDEGPLFIDWTLDLEGDAPLQPGAAAMKSVSLELRRDPERAGRTPLFKLDATRRRVPTADPLYRAERIIAPAVRASYSPFEGVAESTAFWKGKVRRNRPGQQQIDGVTLIAGFPSMYLTKSEENRELARLWLVRAMREAPLNSREMSEPATLSPMDAFMALAARATDEIIQWQSQPTATDLRDWYLFLRQRLSRSINLPVRSLRHYPMELDFADEVVKRLGDSGRPVLLANPLPGDVYEQPLELLGSGVSYLGPLRQEPEVVYRRTSPLNPRFLGKRGEFTAPALHALRNANVDVPVPTGGPGTTAIVPLGQAMNDWLSYLEAATTIQTADRGRLGYELMVTQPHLSRPVDLTSVGVGVSQVVPVVLVCLLSEPGGIVLLEQPELHLHPAMQQRLADFFIALARSGRQLIIETHSEYLMTRLRLRVAEDPTDATSQLVSVFNTSRHEGRTVCQPVTINRYGSIENWPDGFFDQATNEAEMLLSVGLRKRSSRWE